jgi:hypothetical protein
MEITTYSFTDTVGSISHPEVGVYMFDGTGVGSVTISKSTDRTAHDIASDGSVMVSKIAGNNGTVTIECQQTSSIHRWLLAWFNALWSLPTSSWAETAVTLRNSQTHTSHVCMGVSPQKEADTPYQAQGQRVTWTLMCAEITNMPI